MGNLNDDPWATTPSGDDVITELAAIRRALHYFEFYLHCALPLRDDIPIEDRSLLAGRSVYLRENLNDPSFEG